MENECLCGDIKCFVPLKYNQIPITENTELFIKAIDKPCVRIENLHKNSVTVVEWKCKDCGNLFHKRPVDINRRTSSKNFNIICSDCARKATGGSLHKVGKLFIETCPEEASEFVRNIDVPNREINFVLENSHDLCEWKCVYCSKFWTSRAGERKTSNRGKGCPACRKRMIAVQHIKNHNGTSLIEEFPDIANQLVRLVNYPEIDIESVSAGSNQLAEWLCICGASFKRTVNRVVVRKSILCQACTRSGKSLFEFEVAEILAKMTGVSIVTHHKKGKHPEVDLYVPSLDLAIQLDPYWSHYSRFENDVRILEELKGSYAQVVRVRQAKLPKIAGSPSPASKSPTDWAKAAASIFMKNVPELTQEETDEALREANKKWVVIVSKTTVKNNCADEWWAEEFVKNLTHPGKRIEFTTKGSEDLCLWRCKDCGGEWESKIFARDHRVTPHKGCVIKI